MHAEKNPLARILRSERVVIRPSTESPGQLAPVLKGSSSAALNDIPNKRVKVPRLSVFSDSSDDSAALRLLWEEQMENSSRLTSSVAHTEGGRDPETRPGHLQERRQRAQLEKVVLKADR